MAISPTTTITVIISGAPSIANVGDVMTDGVDATGTLRFGNTFSLYDALLYINSIYADDYRVGAQTVVPSNPKG